MAYAVRRFRDDDAESLAELCLAAIDQIGSHGYSNKQLNAWAARHPGAQLYRDRVAAGAVIFVAAAENDTPVAYALIEPDGHLDRLYNHPEHSRQGLAGKLLERAEAHAVSHNISRLYTEASELARPAFERAGYAVTQRRDFEIDHDGIAVPMHNFAMEKQL